MKQLFLFLFTCNVYFINAQGIDKIQYKIVYNFKHLTDTAKQNSFFNEEQILYVGKFSSLYTSYFRMYDDSIRRVSIAEAMNKPDNEIIDLTGKYVIRPFTYESYFINNKKNTIYKWIRFRGSNIAIEDSAKKINWQISNDTKMIAKYSCQKATGKLFGRNYTAWFTTDLPSNAGPWKLNGLCGTILEAYDDKNEVSFSFNKILNYIKPNEQVALPKDAIVMSNLKFKKMVKAFNENPEEFEKANPINSVVTVSIVKIGGGKPRAYVEEKVANTLELDEN